MLFQTWEFAIFFAIVMAGVVLFKSRFKAAWLLAASYYFYAYMNPLFLIFIGYITIADYLLGRGIAATQGKKTGLFYVSVSIINGVLLLAVFKYADFFTANLQALVGEAFHVRTLSETIDLICKEWFNLNYRVPRSVLLPAGLSFFIFKSISYTVDIYRGIRPAEKSIVNYASYLAFFPALLSGPIDRSGLLLEQLKNKTFIRPLDISDGISLFITGLFKKIVLADTLALFVNKVFAADAWAPGSDLFGSLTVAAAAFAFAWQLYGDFSGYTDMARGIAKMMGIHLTLNFNNPYVAVDFSDFWRRWHISLSSWFRDYVYIPLGGSRVAKWRIWLNLFLTMLISGFWHGANWTYIVWGAWHGLMAVIWLAFDNTDWYKNRVPKFVKQLTVFALVGVGWVFFCAPDLTTAFAMLGTMFSGAAGTASIIPWALLIAASTVWAYQLLFDSRWGGVLNYAPVRYALMALIIFLILTIPAEANQKFLYFEF